MVELETKERSKFEVGEVVLIRIITEYGWATEITKEFVGTIISKDSSHGADRGYPSYEVSSPQLGSLNSVMVYENEVSKLSEIGRAIFE